MECPDCGNDMVKDRGYYDWICPSCDKTGEDEPEPDPDLAVEQAWIEAHLPEGVSL